MEDCDWRKASNGANRGGNCVEVAASGAVFVRDSKDPHGLQLAFTVGTWRDFTTRQAAVNVPLSGRAESELFR